ncbi:MAG: Holliday junction branch migration protein RuvA [Bacteroidetes bacterium]|nr:Holliday junction branch migration protein RuvA [Bacteroidota bacterium]
MIAFIKGTLVAKSPTDVLIDTGGLGYRISISLQTFDRLPAAGEPVRLNTHYAIREDGHFLYGFADQQELDLFLHLISVNGVGPKIALSILSAIKVDDFIQHIAHANIRLLKTIPGVGQKMAERLIVELKDKVSKLSPVSQSDWIAAGGNQHQEDAVAALVALGFSRSVAGKTVADVVKAGNSDLKTDELVRLALRQTVR